MHGLNAERNLADAKFMTHVGLNSYNHKALSIYCQKKGVSMTHLNPPAHKLQIGLSALKTKQKACSVEQNFHAEGPSDWYS